jgi:hypothetical protein
MAWTYTPRTGTTASGGSPWTTGYSIALSDVFAIQDDIQTWGGDVNAGGHNLTNCAGVQSSGTAQVNLTSTLVKLRSASNIDVIIGGAVLVTGAVCLSAANDTLSVNIPLEIRSSATLFTAGSVGIGIATTPTSPFQVVLTTYASDAAAGSAGLTVGAFYKDSSGGVHTKL